MTSRYTTVDDMNKEFDEALKKAMDKAKDNFLQPKIVDPSMSLDEIAEHIAKHGKPPIIDHDLTDDEKRVLLTAHEFAPELWWAHATGCGTVSLKNKGYTEYSSLIHNKAYARLSSKGIAWVKANRPPITVAVCNAEGDDITVLEAEPCDAGADFKVTMPDGPKLLREDCYEVVPDVPLKVRKPVVYRPVTEDGMSVESKPEPDESVWNAHKRFSR